MIEGIVVVIVGSMLMFAAPAHDLLATRRQHRGPALGPIFAEAYPFAPASRSMDMLVIDADAALDRDRLVRGVTGLTVIYDQAVEPR